MRTLISITILLPALACAAPEQFVPTTDFIPTQLPFTYVMDYSDGDYFSGSYEKYYERGAPGLLHMGTVTPAHSYFGPAHDANAALGKAPMPPIADFVQKYRERLAEAKRVNDQLRRQGVGKVVAYVCLMTTGGDPDRRLGFWHFYDNWDAFAPLGAGPKPPEDPVQWQQRKPDGSEHHYYTKEHYIPMFFRYSNCVNNPYWQTYMMWVIRGAAEAGFDGVFVDNAGSMRCYCEHCRSGFSEHLRSRYTAAEIKDLFADDLSLAADLQGLRGTETQIFWGESIHSFLEMIRAEGSRLRGSFYVFPNILQGRPTNLQGIARDCALGMAENSIGTYGTHPGRTRSHVIAGIHVAHTNDNMFAHQVSAAAGARCRSALLTRPGYPKTSPAWQMNVPSAELGVAEAAAFSGGGCFLHRPPKNDPDFDAARDKYNKFFAEHKDWYEGYWPAAPVGVLAMLSQALTGDRPHVGAAQGLLETLQSAGLAADPVVERSLPTDFSRYRFLLVPPVKNLPETWVRKLSEYARGGGKLIMSQDPATAALDHLGRPRDEAALAAFRKLAEPLPAAPADLLGPQGPLSQFAILGHPQADGVRCAVYADHPSAPKRMTLHLVNYDVMLGVKGGQVGALDRVPVRLTLPDGRRAQRVTVAVPGGADQVIPCKQDGSRLSFTLPRLDITAVCLVELEERR